MNTAAKPVAHCHKCGRGFVEGDGVYVEDWAVLWPKPHTERRYFCGACHGEVS